MKYLCVGILLLALTGCQTLRVKRDKETAGKEGVHGIPFYITRGYCKQTTEWLEKTYEVTIRLKEIDTVSEESELLWSSSKTINDAVYRTKIEALQKTVSDYNDNALFILPGEPIPDKGIETAWNAVLSIQPLKFPDKASFNTFELIANTVSLESYVDYQTKYYVNAWKPLMGSATVNAELSEKGTLSKSSATIEDKTVETLLTSVLPVKEFLTKKFTTGDTSAAEQSVQLLKNEIQQKIKTSSLLLKQRFYELEIKQKDYKHVLSNIKDVDKDGRCVVASPLDDPSKHSYTRSEVDGEKKEEKKKDEQKITISGEVIMPKSAEKSATK